MSKSSLNSHKLKAKYCLEIQKNIGAISEIKGSELCIHCSKEFLRKDQRQTHELSCNQIEINEYRKTIQTRDDTIAQLMNELKISNDKLDLISKDLKISNDKLCNTLTDLKVANNNVEIYKKISDEKDTLIVKLSTEKSVVNNTNCNNTSSSSSSSNRQNNIIMGHLDLSSEKIKLAVESYSLEHYNRASAGLADWCIDNLLTDNDNNLQYICSDKNRRCFQFKTESGDIVSDPNADKLKSAIKPMLSDRLRIHKKINFSKIGDESDDEDSTKSDLCIQIHNENKTMGVEFEKELVKKTYSKK
ncbi:MAG: hypothetical protein PHG66_04650 [Candidatus Colwellbacteria bacterium]|nr:hypothetical protein [Candidatus Colwellbacteria bacterium]